MSGDRCGCVNDCRWWALNASFRRLLAETVISPADSRHCTEILQYINGLYTVYHNLILFNAQLECRLLEFELYQGTRDPGSRP